ncbi:phasin family protein [Fodinicurvata fenggangensis]|uniref:phasin family protein n=1 Tax=Fodinicurvata fenggangensis TaxID=1121830 RepID=UPI00138E01C7|nr:phasin family protein [Fodinicurvata fenggangensis]
MKKNTTTSGTETENPAEAMAAMNGQVTEAMMSATDNCLKNMAIWQREVADFTARRMKTNSTLLRSLPGCANWDDVVSLQQGWMRTAGEDYIDETGRLMSLSQRLMDGLYAATVRDADRTSKSRSVQDADQDSKSSGE